MYSISDMAAGAVLPPASRNHALDGHTSKVEVVSLGACVHVGAPARDPTVRIVRAAVVLVGHAFTVVFGVGSYGREPAKRGVWGGAGGFNINERVSIAFCVSELERQLHR